MAIHEVIKRLGTKALLKRITYGLLYNKYAINSINELAPTGWHIFTTTEMESVGNGAAVKEVGFSHWAYPNTGATNSSGLTLLPGGFRTNTFVGLTTFGWYRSSTSSIFSVTSGSTSLMDLDPTNEAPPYGATTRCVRNTDVGWVAGEQVVDYDGNIYTTVKIGTYIWMVENLAVTHYRNGTVIPEVTNQSTWNSLDTGALCAYNNDWSNLFG
jgi:hypothetical protein